MVKWITRDYKTGRGVPPARRRIASTTAFVHFVANCIGDLLELRLSIPLLASWIYTANISRMSFRQREKGNTIVIHYRV